MSTDTRPDRPRTDEAAGELRQRLRATGWRSDLGWCAVGSRSARVAVRVAHGAPTRRTIAYLPSLRAVDGGAGKVWKEGDVPAPRVADAREVMLATADADDWRSEVFEAPAVTVAEDDPDDLKSVPSEQAA